MTPIDETLRRRRSWRAATWADLGARQLISLAADQDDGVG